MTEKHIIQCDWHTNGSVRCEETSPIFEASPIPPGWAEFIDQNDTSLHFCPEHARRARGWCNAGESSGPLLTVSHNYVGEDFEEAHVRGDTHSMSISQLLDEPPREFPDYDHDEHEAWGFHVYDHLHVYVIGQHKSEPTVVVQSDEFTTRLVIDDVENSFIHNEWPHLKFSLDVDTDTEDRDE